MDSFLLRHTNPTPTSRYGAGPPARGPTALSTRPQPSTPPGEAGGPSHRRDGGGSAQPGAYSTPDSPVPLGACNRVHAGLFQGEEGVEGRATGAAHFPHVLRSQSDCGLHPWGMSPGGLGPRVYPHSRPD